MINYLKNIFTKKETRPKAVFAYLYQMLKDKEAAAQLEKKGYVVLPFLYEDTLSLLNKNKEIYLSELDKLPEGSFYTSGRDNSRLRNLAKELTWEVVNPLLSNIFNNNECEINGCAWLLKPKGNWAILYPHHDNSLVDETKYPSVYGWIPLEDVNEINGAMYVLPGSHLWGIHYRSLDVKWPLDNHIDFMAKYCETISMKAGEILLFEGALIHGSHENQREQIRAAINLFCKPKEANYVHCLQLDDTPKGKIERYKIDMDFFYNHDIRKRPDSNIFPLIDIVNDYSKNDYSESDVKKLIKKYS